MLTRLPRPAVGLVPTHSYPHSTPHPHHVGAQSSFHPGALARAISANLPGSFSTFVYVYDVRMYSCVTLFRRLRDLRGQIGHRGIAMARRNKILPLLSAHERLHLLYIVTSTACMSESLGPDSPFTLKCSLFLAGCQHWALQEEGEK